MCEFTPSNDSKNWTGRLIGSLFLDPHLTLPVQKVSHRVVDRGNFTVVFSLVWFDSWCLRSERVKVYL